MNFRKVRELVLSVATPAQMSSRNFDAFPLGGPRGGWHAEKSAFSAARWACARGAGGTLLGQIPGRQGKSTSCKQALLSNLYKVDLQPVPFCVLCRSETTIRVTALEWLTFTILFTS